MVSNVLGIPFFYLIDNLPLKALARKSNPLAEHCIIKFIHKQRQSTFVVSNILDVPSCTPIQTMCFISPSTSSQNPTLVSPMFYQSPPLLQWIPYTLTNDRKWNTKSKTHYEGEHDTSEGIYYIIFDASIGKCKATKKINLQCWLVIVMHSSFRWE